MPADRTYTPCYTVTRILSEDPLIAIKSLGQIDNTALTSAPYVTEGDLVYLDTSTGKFEQASAESGKWPQYILVGMSGNINSSDVTMNNPAYGHKFTAVRKCRIMKADKSYSWTPGERLVVVNTTANYSATLGNIVNESKTSGNQSNIVVGYAIGAHEGIIDLDLAQEPLIAYGSASVSSSGDVTVTLTPTLVKVPTAVTASGSSNISSVVIKTITKNSITVTVTTSGSGTVYVIATGA